MVMPERPTEAFLLLLLFSSKMKTDLVFKMKLQPIKSLEQMCQNLAAAGEEGT